MFAMIQFKKSLLSVANYVTFLIVVLFNIVYVAYIKNIKKANWISNNDSNHNSIFYILQIIILNYIIRRFLMRNHI